MTRRFMSGVEAGSMDVFDSYNMAVVDTIYPRTGDYSVEFVIDPVGGTYAWADHLMGGTHGEGDAVDTIYVRAYIRGTSALDTASGLSVFGFYGGSIGSDKIVYFDTAGELYGYYGGVWNDLGGMVTGVDADDTYHLWEIYLKVSQDNVTPDGAITVKRDGAVVYTDTDLQTSDATTVTEVTRVVFAGNIGSVTPDPLGGGYLYYDDIAINDEDDNGGLDPNDGWPGAGAIYGLSPRAAGSMMGPPFDKDEWTPTPGTGEGNWEDVKDVPAVDTTYVTSAQVGDTETYLMDELSALGLSSSAYIAAVNYIIRGKLPSAGSETLDLVYLMNQSNESYPTSISVDDTTFEPIQKILGFDPVTGLEWIADSIDDSEFGFRQG